MFRAVRLCLLCKYTINYNNLVVTESQGLLAHLQIRAGEHPQHIHDQVLQHPGGPAGVGVGSRTCYGAAPERLQAVEHNQLHIVVTLLDYELYVA